MFGRGKKQMTSVVFDRDRQRAVLRCSICTGEKVAGFKDKETGHFTEVMLIRSDAELAKFVRLYQLEESEIIKEY
ncbi:MAG: aspartate dehydrogenase [Lachnospiraceae bacterium]|nr:aspartate dehydrogenase [Lachnospiraceae bacterium]